MKGAFFVNDLSREIWQNKYSGDFTDVEEYYRYGARLISLGNKYFENRFFDMLWNKRFSPGGRILTVMGRPNSKISFANCTTHAVQDDSLEAISAAGYAIMRSSSRGQGIGVDLSALRPAGAPVNNAARTSTGAISFMEMLNNIGGTIGQEGRRAALLFSLSDSHPDLWRNDGYDFLRVKNIPGKVENANISVRISDDLMRAVQNDRDWLLYFNGSSGDQSFLEKHIVRAKDLFRELAMSNWKSAEPGLLFWDTIKRRSNSDLFGKEWEVVGCNACSEMLLDQEGICNLGSLNLAAYVNKPFTVDAYFDFPKFIHDIRHAVIFMDNVITLEIEGKRSFSKQQMRSNEYLRRTGLGVMGLADTLAMLGLTYSMDRDTVKFVSNVFKTLRDVSYLTSGVLAKSRGPARVWENITDRSSILEQGFFVTLPDHVKDSIRRNGTRNITVLSIAPTGSISNLLGVTGSIEPLFARSYKRRVRLGGEDRMVDYAHPGIELSRSLGLSDSVYQTAYEVSPEDHIGMLTLIQSYIDSSVSKTINLSADTAVEDVEKVLQQAWRQGAKGVSIYRDNSRHEQVLYTNEKACPNCGEPLIQKDGCEECPSCNWGKCDI
jgi:ribonucleoside-diphosphate reductase alpha chain